MSGKLAPMRLNPFAIEQLTPTPWKNGGGLTREVVVRPAGAGLDDFDWRVSIATIAAPGPFSPFPGIDRIIVLLDGDGVRLQSDDGRIDHRLDRRGMPFAFAGEARIDCRLLGGPSTDFNLMTRRGRISARLDRIDGRQAGAGGTAPEPAVAGPLPIAEGLVLALHGDWRIGIDRPVPGPGDGGRTEATFGAGRGFWWAATDGSADGSAGGPATTAGMAPLVDLRCADPDACLLRIAIDRA